VIGRWSLAATAPLVVSVPAVPVAGLASSVVLTAAYRGVRRVGVEISRILPRPAPRPTVPSPRIRVELCGARWMAEDVLEGEILMVAEEPGDFAAVPSLLRHGETLAKIEGAAFPHSRTTPFVFGSTAGSSAASAVST
jgi:hypothetical protein